MSVRCNASGSTAADSPALYRYSSASAAGAVAVPNSTTYSACFWFYRISDTNSAGTLFASRNISSSVYSGLFFGANGTRLEYTDTGAGGGTGSNSSATTWMHLGIVKDDVNVTVYLDGVVDITASVTSSLTLTGISFGSVGNFGTPTIQPVDGRFAAMKIWSRAALSQAEIKTEMKFTRPIQQSGLWFFNPLRDPLHDLGTDYSGNGNHFTGVGTLSVEADPTTEDGPILGWSRRRWYFFPMATSEAAAGLPAGGLGLLGVGR